MTCAVVKIFSCRVDLQQNWVIFTTPLFAVYDVADLQAIAERMSTVKNKVLVLSGKGGVGKSTFATQLAFALAGQGKEVRQPQKCVS